jgi:hypothetical protein
MYIEYEGKIEKPAHKIRLFKSQNIILEEKSLKN